MLITDKQAPCKLVKKRRRTAFRLIWCEPSREKSVIVAVSFFLWVNPWHIPFWQSDRKRRD